ncbi:MAG: glycoside hydrolase family 71/99-like protein [Acutalibacteraceae bacterium]|jgi:hypothetical protein
MNTFAASPSPQTARNDLLDKTVAGYQAWFHAGTDPDHGWGHWSHGGAPGVGNLHPEIFPDFSDYPDEALYPGRFAGYPDGRPVKFYSGHDPRAIEVHFFWMEQYGIDGVAVQRFYGATADEPQPEPTHLTAVRDAAERHGRIFYVMYDTSGCGHDGAAAIDRFKADLRHNVEGKGLISSPAYAHADGKPVICVWGLAGTEPGRYPAAADALELVRWLKERGYFVIGGLPDNRWTDVEDDYAAVYAALDMASPWTPGRFRMETLGDWIDRHLAKDLAYCKAHGMRYQPVMFAGFAWSNFGGGGDANASPRLAGQFLWEQARRYAAAGIRHGYFAMFDEYDEGTAIAKAASDSFDLPVGEQYAQTMSCDGIWLSRDYYLREAAAVSDLLRGNRPLTDTPGLPHSTGPVYWRNGFEMRPANVTAARRQTTDTRLRPVDVCAAHGKVLEQEGVQLETADVIAGRQGDVCYTGRYGFAFSGYAMTDGDCRVKYRLAKTDIPVVDGLTLTYRIRATDAAGAVVGVDLLFDDGRWLSEIDPAVTAPKEDPLAHPKFPYATWRAVTHRLDGMAGRRIQAVAVLYAAHGEARFAAYLDDVVIAQ